MTDEKQQRVIHDTNLVCKNAKCWNWTRMIVSALQFIWCASRAAIIIVVSNWEYLNEHKITDEEKKRLNGQIVIYAIILLCWVFAALLSYAVWHVTAQLQEFVDMRKMQVISSNAIRIKRPIIPQLGEFNNLANLKDQLVPREKSQRIVEHSRRGSEGGPLSTDRGMISNKVKVPAITGFTQMFSESDSPEERIVPRLTEELRFNPLRFGSPQFNHLKESSLKQNVPRITEELRTKPLRFGIPEVNHLEESTPKKFISRFNTMKGNNLLVPNQNENLDSPLNLNTARTFDKSEGSQEINHLEESNPKKFIGRFNTMKGNNLLVPNQNENLDNPLNLNTARTFDKSEGSQEIKDGEGMINNPTKNENRFQPIRCPTPEKYSKKKMRLGPNSTQVSRGKGFPKKVLELKAPNEGMMLTGETPKLSEGMALEMSGNKRRPSQNNFLNEAQEEPVNGLQLLAAHIGHLGGKMPKLREGDRWKIQRAKSIVEKQKKKDNKAIDDDWE
jgi:hypothetical protein